MNLLDHFRGPLQPLWGNFHNVWMAFLAKGITANLPPKFVAYSSSRLGIEIDVAAFEGLQDNSQDQGWQPTWTPPPPDADAPFAPATDELEVRLLEVNGVESRLVAAVEFVSPANKDRPETRDAFVSKCHGYLADGIGLIIVDAVTTRHANLHDELMARLGIEAQTVPGHLYATSYRPTGANGDGRLDIWRRPLTIGGPLPTLPLWLLGGVCAPADLATSYDRACDAMPFDRMQSVYTPTPAAQPT